MTREYLPVSVWDQAQLFFMNTHYQTMILENITGPPRFPVRDGENRGRFLLRQPLKCFRNNVDWLIVEWFAHRFLFAWTVKWVNEQNNFRDSINQCYGESFKAAAAIRIFPDFLHLEQGIEGDQSYFLKSWFDSKYPWKNVWPNLRLTQVNIPL